MQTQPASAQHDLAQEACYRAIGEGFMHIAEHFSFANWYSQELRFLLQAPPSRVSQAPSGVSQPHTIFHVTGSCSSLHVNFACCPAGDYLPAVHPLDELL